MITVLRYVSRCRFYGPVLRCGLPDAMGVALRYGRAAGSLGADRLVIVRGAMYSATCCASNQGYIAGAISFAFLMKNL